MSQIIVAYDGSDASNKGLEKAISLLGEGDEIILVSILPSAKIREMSSVDSGENISNLRERANEALAGLRKRKIEAIAIIKEGDIIEELLEIADETKCSMLVIGAGGISKIGKFALGSVADAISRRATRPVLIVK